MSNGASKVEPKELNVCQLIDKKVHRLIEMAQCNLTEVEKIRTKLLGLEVPEEKEADRVTCQGFLQQHDDVLQDLIVFAMKIRDSLQSISNAVN